MLLQFFVYFSKFGFWGNTKFLFRSQPEKVQNTWKEACCLVLISQHSDDIVWFKWHVSGPGG